MHKIVAPIKAQDKGPAVVNLQHAMLFIVQKKQLSPADHSLDRWKQVISGELAQQLFAEHTLRPLLASIQPLHIAVGCFAEGKARSTLVRRSPELED
jgi:hypothetical protein